MYQGWVPGTSWRSGSESRTLPKDAPTCASDENVSSFQQLSGAHGEKGIEIKPMTPKPLRAPDVRVAS